MQVISVKCVNPDDALGYTKKFFLENVSNEISKIDQIMVILVPCRKLFSISDC